MNIFRLWILFSEQNLRNETQVTTDIWGGMCKNFKFQFSQYSNGSNGRSAQTEEKLHNVDRL